ncbi:MAG TPA: hypothetical protein VN772_05490 [Solirubrobacteraceae bacterium]|nr:hypothetical protein [Solirubrobacteraceae bacterium]HXR29014.1 hypothetical protein [Solirubrobacteraceae bacterium]
MSRPALEHTDLAAALAAVRAPLSAPAMPSVGLGLRVRTSARLRGLLPTRLAVALARARGRSLWRRNPLAREQALRTMDAIVGGTARAAEAAVLAREHVIEHEVHRVLFWQPWKPARMDAASAAHVRQAIGSGRGVLLSSSHLGPIFLHLSAITSLKRGYIVSAPWFFEQPTPDFWGRRLAHWWARLTQRNERLVCSTGAYPVLAELLRQGELVVVYFDMPGGRRTQFLGKPVMLASGSARLAMETDSLLLPVRARLKGHRAWTDAAAPLDPRDFDSHEDLHDALAAAQERFILELPATLEDPNRAGAWEQGASAAGWTRPQEAAEAPRSAPDPPGAAEPPSAAGASGGG